MGNEQLDGPVHSLTFIMLTCLRSSSRAGGCMTWAYISRRLKATCQSITKKHVLCTNNHTCNAEALRSCWSWK